MGGLLGGSAGRPKDRRIKVLEMYGLIETGRPRDGSRRSDSAGVAIFICGRGTTIRCLDDAVKSYYAAVALVATTIGQDFSDGKIVISQALV